MTVEKGRFRGNKGDWCGLELLCTATSLCGVGMFALMRSLPKQLHRREYWEHKALSRSASVIPSRSS